MTNPWLTIPLADYEGHMASPVVGQAEMVAHEFEVLLKIHVPTTVALIGCAGGNGFEKAAEVGITRLVGIDINANYIADAKIATPAAFQAWSFIVPIFRATCRIFMLWIWSTRPSCSST